jgi:hypothetical protein
VRRDFRCEDERRSEAFFGAAMSLPLGGCWAKIERANENIKNLEAEIAAFVRPDPYIVVGNVDHQKNECTFVANAKTIPLRFSVLAGEIIHHLRSSLDHLMCALVLQRSNVVNSRHGFPICLNEKDFRAARKTGKMEGISGAAEAIVERLQPYRNADWRNTVSDNPLSILHQFNNTDKHRLLAVIVSAARTGYCHRTDWARTVVRPTFEDRSRRYKSDDNTLHQNEP